MRQSLIRRVLYWYHFYLNHPDGIRLIKTIREVCYWKGLFIQAELFTKMRKTCQQFKKRKTLYEHLPPNNIAELKTWYLVHVDLIGPYRRSIRQQQPGGTVIRTISRLTFMIMIEPAQGWFEFVEITTFNLKEVMEGNDNT